MFTPLCKLFYLLQRKPGWLFAAAVLATIAALVPLRDFEVRASALDLLPRNWESVQAWKEFGREFGSAGHLAVVVHSEDPVRNAGMVKALADALEKHPDINFLEFRTEADFYRDHKLLYISLEDLREVERRVGSGFWLSRPRHNPMVVDLSDTVGRGFDAAGFEDLEAKYFSRLKDLHGSADSTTLVLRIYPSFDVNDIHACRAFVAHVQGVANGLATRGAPVEILFTGEVMRTIQNEGRLFSRLLHSTRMALYLTGALLLLLFLRIPAGAFLALFPVSMAVIWTAALTHLWLGPLGIVSAPLSLLLIGLGIAGAVHLLARYAEERRKRLSASVAFETITLETGPAIAAGLVTLALAFLTFRTTQFRALADFGLVAGIGMLCTVIAVLAVFPALLRLVEPTGLLQPRGERLYNTPATEQPRPFRHAKLFLVIAAVLSAVVLRHGPQWRFLHDVDTLGFRGDATARADSLLRAAGEELISPAVFLARDADEALYIAEELRRRQLGNPDSEIGDVATLKDLLPADQEEKLVIASRLRATLTPELIAQTQGSLRASLKRLTESWPERALTSRDLPETYRLKFTGREGYSGVFTYAFPKRHDDEGVNVLDFAREVGAVTLPNGEVRVAGGWAVVYGELVRGMLPDTQRAMVFGLGVIFIVLWLTVASFRGALLLLLPVIATLLWTLGCIKWLGIRVNPYNLIAFPVALSYATLHALVLHHRYEEEGRGSIPLVLRRTGITALAATGIAAIGFVPMAFSDHYGLASLGITTLIGLAASLLSTILLLGGILGLWEARKLKKEKTAH